MTEATGIMTLPGLEALQTPEGEELMEEATRFTDPLLAVTVLRRRFPADLVGMAVELADLRRRAETKFVNANRMFFTREALEQASGGRIATYRAQRYASYDTAVDWGCGVGIDSMALARVTHAIGIDIDALRIAMARSNARVLGRTNVDFVVANYLTRPPDGPAIWADPARRVEGHRMTDPERYSPPLDQIIAHAAGRPLGVKVSPAVAAEDIPRDVEAEFISVNGELKEAVFWFGELRTASRRATVLPENATIVPSGEIVQIAAPGNVLYDPDPAVVRAGAVTDLGRMLGAWLLDPSVAYLTGYSPVDTPFAQTLTIEDVRPWNLKDVKRTLRSKNMRVEEVRKRGSAVDADAVRKELRSTGDTPVSLVLTRVDGKPTAILATRWRP